MRLFSLAAMLALGFLLTFSIGENLIAGKAPQKNPPPPPPPVYRPPVPTYRPVVNVPRPNTNVKPPPGKKIIQKKYEVTFTYNTEVGKVRLSSPPTEYDEKGNIKKYKKSELLALKGDGPGEKKMVGYKAEFSDLVVGDTIEVAISVYQVVKKKKTTKTKTKSEDEEEDKTKEEETDKTTKTKEGKWIVQNVLSGKVTKLGTPNTDNAASTVTITFQVPQIVPQNWRPPVNQYGQPGQNNVNRQTIKPEAGQATLIVIGQRIEVPPPKN